MASQYDVCIIGAGIAGALVAAQCSKRGKRVVILEAGGRFDRGKRFEQLEQYLATGDAWRWQRKGRDEYVDTSEGFSYELNTTRIKGVGGTTLHWGGVAQRLDPTDFRTLSLYGYGVDWPITYETLEPYYGLAERELGVSGDSAVHADIRSTPYPMAPFPDAFSDGIWRRAAARIGATVDRVSYAKNTVAYRGRPPCQAYSTCTICPVGAQYSADVHVAEAEATGRCTVMTDTVARRIEIDSRGRVQAVHTGSEFGRPGVITADHFVVAAHAIESARLLLLSGIGSESGHVGRNLMEHFYVSGEGVVPERLYPLRIGFETLQSASFYGGEERRERGAIKIELGQGIDPFRAQRSATLWGKELAKFEEKNFSHLVSISAETEHVPNPASLVDLDPVTKDMFGDAVPRLHFALGEFETATQASAVAAIAKLLEAAGASDVTTNGQPAWAAHHLGTCRMAADPGNGVLDRDLKVFGTTNLYVAGSACFATGGALQPTLTIAALSLRLAELLNRN